MRLEYLKLRGMYDEAQEFCLNFNSCLHINVDNDIPLKWNAGKHKCHTVDSIVLTRNIPLLLRDIIKRTSLEHTNMSEMRHTSSNVTRSGESKKQHWNQGPTMLSKREVISKKHWPRFSAFSIQEILNSFPHQHMDTQTP